MELTLQLLPRLGGWQVAKDAAQLVRLGKVRSFGYAPPILEGVVITANGPVKARLRTGQKDSDFENLCSCREARETGRICAHVLAVAHAWIERDKVPPPAEPPSEGTRKTASTPASQPPPVTRMPRVTLSDAGETSTILRIKVILPIDLLQLSAPVGCRLFLEGSLDDGPFRPLDVAVRDLANREAPLVSESDDTLLTFCEVILRTPPAHALVLAAPLLDPFLLSIAGHPDVWRGKKERLTIIADDERPTIRIAPHGDKGLFIDVQKDAKGIPIGNWRLDGLTLRRSPVLTGLPASGPIFGEALDRFVASTLPGLGRLAEVIVEPGCDEIVEVAEIPPRFHLRIDGGLHGLHAELSVEYPGASISFLLEPGFEPASIPVVMRSGGGSTRFFRRNVPQEGAAVARLRQTGFLPGKRNPALFVLQGEAAASEFLANDLPILRSEWHVELLSRLEELLEGAEWVAPSVGFVSSGEDWLATEFSCSTEGLGFNEALALIERGRFVSKSADGRLLLLGRQSFNAARNLVTELDGRQTAGGPAKFDKRQSLSFRDLLNGSGIQLKTGSGWSPPPALAEPPPIPAGVFPEGLLRPYQAEGVQWLMRLSHNSLAGILADEMGLGKTLQTLCWLAARRAAAQNGPSLVVCPTSLLFNWLAEATRFVPQLRTHIYHGPDRHKREGLGTADLIITSYALARKDIEQFLTMPLDVIVLDEAQNIKNPGSQIARALRRLPATARLALTGTPIENRPLDLWSIFEFLMPGFLGGEKAFLQKYEGNAKDVDLPERRKRLAARLRPFILRRTKALVATELPPRIDQTLPCDLSAEQRGVYASLLETARRRVSELAGASGSVAKRRMTVLQMLLRLRQACCHLDLLPKTGEKVWSEPSGKMTAWWELLEEARNSGHRMLVFSQFTSMLDLLQQKLVEESISFCRLDGSTTNRAAEVARFQEEPGIPVFLIILKAGGAGLNLTAADHVVLFDPWWNPAVEEQAAARAHRIGRRSMVTVHKLVARGTVEEKIVALQDKKRGLADQLLDGGGDGSSAPTLEDLENLLSEK